jgi:hypothetical protein
MGSMPGEYIIDMNHLTPCAARTAFVRLALPWLAVEPREDVLHEVSSRRTEPRIEHGPDRIEGVADWLGDHLHQIDVLGIACHRTKVELVECGATAERERIGYRFPREQLDDRS